MTPQTRPPETGLIDVAAIGARLESSRASFAAARPFPHLVLDEFLPEEVAGALAAEFDLPEIPWQSLHHVNERKLVCSDHARMGPMAAAVIDELYSSAFRRMLSSATGIPALIGDPDLDGAGLHRTCDGGHLNVHADALAHTKRRTWSRQLNLILFLNRDWDESRRGWLELWDESVDRCVQRISPVWNRCVLFQTSAISFHGVPEGVSCSAAESRKSLALYYFRDEGRVVGLRPTRYVPRPNDPPLRRALIRLDRAMVAGFSLLKRYTGLDNARASRILRRF